MKPRRIMNWVRFLWPGLLAVWLAGCVIVPGANPDLLKFLQVGQTTREEVLLQLGQPSMTLDHERVLTYRIGEDSEAARFVIAPRSMASWEQVQYSLVLIFDENGRLQKQSLVRVH